MGRHSVVTTPFSRRIGLGAGALAASAALTAGLAFGDGQAAAANAEVTSLLADTHDQATELLDQIVAQLGIESQGIAGGTALGPSYLIGELAGLLNVDASVITSALSLVGVEFGNELAIAIFPGIAAAVPIGEGTSATAISVLGIAVATDGVTSLANGLWNTVVFWVPIHGDVTLGDLAGLAGVDRGDLPDDTVFCLGAFAAANSGTAGSCLNILATVDARYIKVSQGETSGEVQLALTNPASVLSLLADSDQLLDALAQVITGDPIYLTKDFLRLSLNGPEDLALTSDYGYDAPIVISWLGSNLVLFPGTAQTHGVNGDAYVNYLSAPEFTFGTPTSLVQLIPTFNVPEFNVADLFAIPAFNTADLLGGLTTTTSTTTSATSVSVPVSTLAEENPSLLQISDPAVSESSDDQGSDSAGGAQEDSAPATTVETSTPVITPSDTETSTAGEGSDGAGQGESDETQPVDGDDGADAGESPEPEAEATAGAEADNGSEEQPAATADDNDGAAAEKPAA